MKELYDVVIIGSGPGGYVSAIRAAQLGLSVALVEKKSIGGTCLNIGCIPTKALLKSAEVYNEIKKADLYGISVKEVEADFPKMISQKNEIVSKLTQGVHFLLKRSKVEIFFDTASISGPTSVLLQERGVLLKGRHILISTGSHNAVPPIPGLTGKNIFDSTSALEMQALPKEIVVLGGGVIGLELGDIFHTLGADVTILEMAPTILGGMDIDCIKYVENNMIQKGIRILTNAKVTSIRDVENRKEVIFNQGGETRCVSSEAVLVAAGRKPNSQGLNLEKVGVATTNGWIDVNQYMQTSIPTIYAVGDVTGRVALAHAAYEAGIVAVEHMRGGSRRMDFDKVPKVVFTNPEIASVGMTEREAEASGHPVSVGKFMMTGNGKALTMRASNGFVKIISADDDHRILGAHLAGVEASELIAIASNWMAAELTLDDVAEMTFPHPSLAEALKEGCLAAMGKALHG